MSINGRDEFGQPANRLLANLDSSSTDQAKGFGSMFKNMITDLFPSRELPNDWCYSIPESVHTKIMPLEPLKIDEVQTSPVLGEIEIFRPTK